MKTISCDPINVIYDEPNVNKMNRGLTKREYFAAMAMQGLTSNHKWAKNLTQDDWDDFTNRIASGACVIADKLINELNKDS